MKKLILFCLLLLLLPAAFAETKEEIAAELGVFQVREQACVTGIELIPEKGCPQFVMTLEDGIIWGGTEISRHDWFTGGGIMSEADVDLDGDGVKEYVVAYSRISEDEYREPELLLRIYARDGEEFALKGESPLAWAWENEQSNSWVRIVPQKKGAVIFSGSIGFGDGGSCYVNVRVYGYDGESCTIPLFAFAVNYGEHMLIRNVKHPELLGEYLRASSFTLEENPPDEDYDYIDHHGSSDSAIYGPLSTEGFENINAHLRKYGLEMIFTKHTMKDWGYVSADYFTGGTDFHTTSSDEYVDTLTIGMSGPCAEAQTEGLETWKPELSDDPRWNIMPDSNWRKLTKAELSGCDAELLGYIRNEILARHGYPFKKEKYQTYFGSKYWYEEDANFSYSMLSDAEAANVELIKSME